MKSFTKFILFSIALILPIFANKDRCGSSYGVCDGNDCCSLYNWCGTSDEHCGSGCQPAYGHCQSNINPGGDDDDYDGKVEWVGFRFSEGGVKSSKNYGKVPDGDKWIEFVNKFKRHFNSDAKPTVIVIVSQNAEDVINIFGFPAPNGYYETDHIMYYSKDIFENILTKFDQAGINAWLQVEPGDNDIITLAKIVFKQYGHHSCVKGFGIDLEWWYREGDGQGKKLTADYAQRVVNYVRSINPSYTVFAKHWDPKFMPESYIEGMIYIDDSQELGSLSGAKSEFRAWAKKFPNNPVMFQIGYAADRNLWGNSPVDFAKAISEEVTQYNNHVGIIWVDFTMKEALEKM